MKTTNQTIPLIEEIFSIEGKALVGKKIKAYSNIFNLFGTEIISYKWETSSNGNFWQKVGDADEYVISNNDEGKNIKCTLSYKDSLGVFHEKQLNEYIYTTSNLEQEEHNFINTSTSKDFSADGLIAGFGFFYNSRTERPLQTGLAKIYSYNDKVWSQIGDNISGNYNYRGDIFGHDLSISDDGEIVAIGSNSYAKVFEYIDNDWQQIGEDIKPNTDSSTSSTNNYIYVELSSDGSFVCLSFGEQIAIFESCK